MIFDIRILYKVPCARQECLCFHVYICPCLWPHPHRCPFSCNMGMGMVIEMDAVMNMDIGINMDMDTDMDTETDKDMGIFERKNFWIEYWTASILDSSDMGKDLYTDIMTGPTLGRDTLVQQTFSGIGLKRLLSDIGYSRHYVQCRCPPVLCVQY